MVVLGLQSPPYLIESLTSKFTALMCAISPSIFRNIEYAHWLVVRLYYIVYLYLLVEVSLVLVTVIFLENEILLVAVVLAICSRPYCC